MTSSASRELVVQRTREIVELHLGIESALRRSVQDAIRIGELLTAQKEALGHGNFLAWVERELPFAERTAQNYMRVFQYRSKTATVADLRTAYEVAQIEDQRQHPRTKPVDPELVERRRRNAEEFARRMKEEDARARKEDPKVDYQEILRKANQMQDRIRASTERELAGDQDPRVILDEIMAFCEVQLSRTRASGLHMVVNEMVKFWREKSIELNRKAMAAAVLAMKRGAEP